MVGRRHLVTHAGTEGERRRGGAIGVVTCTRRRFCTVHCGDTLFCTRFLHASRTILHCAPHLSATQYLAAIISFHVRVRVLARARNSANKRQQRRAWWRGGEM